MIIVPERKAYIRSILGVRPQDPHAHGGGRHLGGREKDDMGLGGRRKRGNQKLQVKPENMGYQDKKKKKRLLKMKAGVYRDKKRVTQILQQRFYNSS